MRTGELDQRVILRRKTLTQNEYGTLVESDDDFAEVWASVRPMSGRERFHADQTQPTANYMVTIRNRRDLTESDYIVWRGGEMNIRFIRDRGSRSLWLEIECEKT